MEEVISAVLTTPGARPQTVASNILLEQPMSIPWVD